MNGENVPLFENNDAKPQNKWNQGRRIDWSWICGLKQILDCLDGNSLISITEGEGETVSVIHLGEWSAYSNLNITGLSPSDCKPLTLCGFSDWRTHSRSHLY